MQSNKIELISEIISYSALIFLIASSFVRDSILSSFFNNCDILPKRFADAELMAFLVLIMFIIASILKNVVYEVNKEVPILTSKFRKLSIDIGIFIVGIIILLANITHFSGIILSILNIYYIALLIIEMIFSHKSKCNKV